MGGPAKAAQSKYVSLCPGEVRGSSREGVLGKAQTMGKERQAAGSSEANSPGHGPGAGQDRELD